MHDVQYARTQHVPPHYRTDLPTYPHCLPPPSVRCLSFLRFPPTSFLLESFHPSEIDETSRRGRDRTGIVPEFFDLKSNILNLFTCKNE